jgi:peptidoglycan/LPS O-acetylase OafA/YrhL
MGSSDRYTTELKDSSRQGVSVRKPALAALTGLRFCAALYVVSLHYAPETLRAVSPAVRNFISAGYTAVSLFFLLSGFVLAYNYLDPERGINVNPRKFWVARFARIYPAYLLGLVLTAPGFIAQMLHDAPSTGRAAARIAVFGGLAAGLLQAWSPKAVLLWNFPGWSLSVEVFFYLMFPFLAVHLLSRWRTPRVLLAAAGALWILSQIPPILYLAIGLEGPLASSTAMHGLFNLTFDDVGMRFVRFNPLLHICEFLIGMCVGKLFLIRRYPVRGETALIAAVALCGFLSCSWFLPFPMLHNGLLAPIMCLLIFSLSQSGGVLGRVLSTPAFQLAGEASYSFYILQVPIWTAFSGLLGVQHPHGMVDFVLYVVLLFGLSVGVFYYIEVPGRTWIKKRLRGPAKEKSTDMAAGIEG